MIRSITLLGMCLASMASARAIPATFRFKPDGAPSRVSLGGTFNNWSFGATPMTKGMDGTWTTTLDLAPGPYMFKYVLDGSRWVADPSAPTIPPDGNNVLWVVPEGQTAESKRGDDKVLEFAVRAEEPVRLDRYRVRLQVRVAANDVQGVDLFTLVPEGQPSEPALLPDRWPMRRTATDGLTDTYSVTIPVTKEIGYYFGIKDGGREWQLTRSGPSRTPDLVNNDVGVWDGFTMDPQKMPYLETPDWVRDTVWYQVFPERFWNGNKANDPAPPKGVPSWDTPLSAVSGNPNSHWWGGDLEGVIENIPYLKSLGITGIYLNPIFAGPDTHLYATTDYRKVAPEMGDADTLKRLVDTAHANGMRVMLDGVFNHTSVHFFAFRDILENQENSAYKDWYFIRRWPVLDPVTHYTGPDERNIPYDGWYGIKWMPKLNTTNPETEKYLLDVATYWIKAADIDGWRLDVANEVSPEFWRKFRKAVKAAKPDAYIIGEIWEDASPWLKGDQFDAVMNYRFRGAALDFFARGTSDAAKFARDLEAVRNDYPPQATAVMFNLLGSHDTARFRTEAGGSARRVALATLFQMTYPGAPSLYYGDEVGMEGATDPMNRAPMVWDASRQDTDLLTSVRRAIALRRTHPALRGLEVQTLAAPAGGKAVAFLRRGGGETAVTAFNASNEEQTLELPVKSLGIPGWRDAWRGGRYRDEGGTLTVTLPPMSASVLVEEAAAKGKKQ